MKPAFTKLQFIEKCSKIHNNYFNYDNSDYINKRSKIIITCPVHGDIIVNAGSHMKGTGCSKCSDKKYLSSKNDKYATRFKNLGNKIHNFKYDYSKSVYITSKIPLIIICPVHGEFLQTPSSHIINKHGCFKCNHPGSFGSIAKYTPNAWCQMYYLKLFNDGETFFKIGLTTKKSLNKRINNFKRFYNVEIIEVMEGTAAEMYNNEQDIIKMLKELKINYKPKYEFEGYTKCFKW